jgi:hypothetical protein
LKGTVKPNYRLGMILKLLVRPANPATYGQRVRAQIIGPPEIAESRIVSSRPTYQLPDQQAESGLKNPQHAQAYRVACRNQRLHKHPTCDFSYPTSTNP